MSETVPFITLTYPSPESIMSTYRHTTSCWHITTTLPVAVICCACPFVMVRCVSEERSSASTSICPVAYRSSFQFTMLDGMRMDVLLSAP